jgi:hypothetical protein
MVPTNSTTPETEVVVSFPILIIEEAAPLAVEVESSKPSPESQPTETPSVPASTVLPATHKVPDHAGILSTDRQFALGMIETGNNDSLVGGLGEVSRYQIMPSVWKVYSESRSYQDTDVATDVARQHWTSLYDYFKKKTGREPSNFDMYVLWNTRFGYYSAKGFEPARLHPVVRDRAERFANLVEDSQRRAAELAMAALR